MLHFLLPKIIPEIGYVFPKAFFFNFVGYRDKAKAALKDVNKEHYRDLPPFVQPTVMRAGGQCTSTLFYPRCTLLQHVT